MDNQGSQDKRNKPQAKEVREVSDVEKEFNKMEKERVVEIYNRSKQAKEFTESAYGRLIMGQLHLWVELADDTKKNTRLYNYEMGTEGRKLYIAALCDEVRRDAIHDIVETIEQDIRMGGYAETELKKRG